MAITTQTPTQPQGVTLLGAEFLTDDDLARELDVSRRTIARWNAKRQGPPRIIQGRTILYKRSSVIRWLEDREQSQPRARRR